MNFRVTKLRKVLYRCIPAWAFRYNPRVFATTFLANNYSGQTELQRPIPRKLYCFWTGDNELTPNRKRSLEQMRERCGVELVLVTPQNLQEFVLPDYPLHPAYEHLSLNHRSDYLRCYFMHHYGGGYSDIKECHGDWSTSFDRLERSSKLVLGYPELSPRTTAMPSQEIFRRKLPRYFRVLVGNGAFILRRRSPLTFDWYAELHSRMDFYAAALAENPGNTFGDNPGYPVAWTELMGDIFHPLCLKYFRSFLRSDMIKPTFRDYR